MPGTTQVEMTFTVTVSGITELAAVGKVLAHPLRLLMIRRFADMGRLSPSELGELLEEPLGNVSYHVRELARQGVVALVDTQPRRGVVEHFYALTPLGARIAGGMSG